MISYHIIVLKTKYYLQKCSSRYQQINKIFNLLITPHHQGSHQSCQCHPASDYQDQLLTPPPGRQLPACSGYLEHETILMTKT